MHPCSWDSVSDRTTWTRTLVVRSRDNVAVACWGVSIFARTALSIRHDGGTPMETCT